MVTVQRDSYCTTLPAPDGIQLGVIQAGTQVELLQQADVASQVLTDLGPCWLKQSAFLEPDYIHPDDLAKTIRWLPIAERFLPEFSDTLTKELVLSVIWKETKGDPHAVDQTGLDVALVGQASVGLMGAIPRSHLPCYGTLTGPKGADEYPCQVYLGMWILDNTIRQAREIRLGHTAPFDPADMASDVPFVADDVRYGLAFYNCSVESVLADRCLPWGGLVYADVILDQVLPEMTRAIQ